MAGAGRNKAAAPGSGGRKKAAAPGSDRRPDKARRARAKAKAERIAQRLARGLCRDCDNKRHPKSASRCGPCLKKRRAAQRKKDGYKPWRKGGRGRKPVV